MTRVMSKALDPSHTAIGKVMTPHPRCVPPELRVSDAALPGPIEQVAREHAVHHLQHKRHQLGLCGQQQAQRDG